MFRTQKKRTGKWSARRAAFGARTLKLGQNRFFLGYKKHTLRLWLWQYEAGVLLVPLVSWIAPANVAEVGFIKPSLQRCQGRWGWRPDVVVGDLAYVDAARKREIRQRWQVAVITRLRENMQLVPPFETPQKPICREGQSLQWLGYEAAGQEHWFGVRAPEPMCARCWQASVCPREFSFRAETHETLLGLLPLHTRTAQRLLQQVRPWIEPAQSYEKNQLGLNQFFLNSLRLTWSLTLLADAAVLLRASALLEKPQPGLPLFAAAQRQLQFDLPRDEPNEPYFKKADLRRRKHNAR